MKLLLTIPFIVFAFCLTAQAPVNDDCAGIINLGEAPYCSTPGQYTNVNATTSNIDPQFNIPNCFNNNAERDVWFQFSLPADGSITDITITVLGAVNGNGTLRMPQLAIYRGDCLFGGLSELSCIAAPLNINELQLDFLGLNPGETYFLRINDYSATGTPNAGTFKLCIEEYVAAFNMGEVPGTQSCTGTLLDSGGAGAAYQSNENLTFTICPQDFHQCIQINLVEYFTEEGFDFLRVYEGNGTTGLLLAEFDGFGSDEQINVSGGGCATIEFQSDETIMEEGFEFTWQCTADVCPAPPPTPPSASTCEAALPINGCDQDLANIISLAPGEGDPDFIVDDVNAGCILTPSQDLNFAFFYFKAQSDGEFGFLVQNGDPNNPSDIDFNVWGPIANEADICAFVSNNQPIRSSWTAAPDFDNLDGITGLTNTNPYTGAPITDEFDCGGPNTPGTGNLATDDSFVSTIPVLAGEIYVVMLDDYDGAVESGDGISIDFSGTTANVLDPIAGADVTVPDDVAICAGQSVQLQVIGGLDYAWSPASTLSCIECPNPIALPTETTTYLVQIATVCDVIKDSVTVSFLSLDLGPDANVCVGASFMLNENAAPGEYVWSGNGATGLDCLTCASPTFTATAPGTYTLTCTLNTPAFCTLTGMIDIVVVSGMQPAVSLLPDTAICVGDVISLGGPPNIDYEYTWTSNPPNLVPAPPTASFAPTGSATFYVKVTSTACAFPRIDSVVVELFQRPVYTFPEGKKCAGELLTLNLQNDPSVTQWAWASMPPSDIDSIAQPAVVLSANGIDQPTTFYLEAFNGCIARDTFTIAVTGVALTMSPPTTICQGLTQLINAEVSLGGGQYSWSNGAATQATLVMPTEATTYTVTYTFNDCTFQDSVLISVQGETPDFLFPTDVALCPGDAILLNGVQTPDATYSWTAEVGGVVTQVTNPNELQVLYESTNFSVTATLNGCSITKELPVTVFTATLSVTDEFSICAGEEFTLSATGSATGSYLWTPGDNAAPSFADTVFTEQIIDYALLYTIGTPGNECYLNDTVTVNVLPNFNIKIVADPDSSFNAGESVMLDAVIQPSQSLNGFTFEWLENNTTTVGNTQQISVTPVTSDPSIIYTVTVVSPNGCSQVQTIEFRVFQPIVAVPNAFTPNGDGFNDVFRLAVLEGKVTVERFEIYNRWGQKVFESFEPEAAWNGRSGDTDMPSEVYIYKIRYRRGDGSLVKPLSGEVTLIR